MKVMIKSKIIEGETYRVAMTIQGMEMFEEMTGKSITSVQENPSSFLMKDMRSLVYCALENSKINGGEYNQNIQTIDDLLSFDIADMRTLFQLAMSCIKADKASKIKPVGKQKNKV